MVLRCISQFRILRIVRSDDVLMIIAWILQTVKAALSTIAVYWGLGRHDWQLASSEAFVDAMKYEMLSMIFGSLCGLFGRISFAAFLLYFIQRVSRIRTYVIWTVIIVQVVVTIVLLIYNMVKCAPSVHGPRAIFETAECWTSPSIMALQYSQGAVNAASNLCLTILALGLVCSIHAASYAKASLGILLSFSLLATIADVLAIVGVSRTRHDGTDYAYRLDTWNYLYSIENAVIIITGSMSKLRPVILVVYHFLKDFQTMDKLRKWKNPQTPRVKFLRLTAGYHPTNTSRRSPSPSHPFAPPITVTAADTAGLHRFKSRTSIYSKNSKHRNGHSRHLGNTSNATSTISLSSIPHSSSLHPTTRLCGDSNQDLPSFDQTSSIISRDFVPVSSPRLTYQTVITAGDPSVPPPFVSLPSSPPRAATPTPTTRRRSLSTPNSSERTSRNSSRRRGKRQLQPLRDDGFTTTNSSFFFFPGLDANNGRQSPSLLMPILQTNHFSIEYEDGNEADARNESYSNSVNSFNNNGTNHRQTHSRDVELGWTTMRHDNHRDGMAGTYSHDEADSLQLHDVGSILKGSEGN
ncbi:hypothetical protein UA08_05625 [Talaromyces atroroseus]|uniref:Rhodopsin domain-containing protein n=1 Tax=Talaromyces atroroseus TaxID=1441469 RepID=A0A225AD42_TALAT|nr:hypothetical protein UA08_05625 [Talaromyces atroroseus]OKL59081.1 hypothetical protein UA08_05625 [Talaromyces atroroseus]